jgi:predicted RNA-binding protein Jag
LNSFLLLGNVSYIRNNPLVLKENLVIVDIDHYKKSREEKVLQIAKEKADSARAMQISQVMPPLDPYLRKLVHTYFNTPEYSDITTESIGEGSNRRLQLSCNPHS